MKRFKNIVYVAGAESEPGTALARAAALARNNRAHLTVMAVVPAVKGLPSGGRTASELQAILAKERRLALKDLIRPHSLDLNVTLDVRFGKTFLEVIRAVLRNAHDLVIKPAEQPDWLARLFGSDDMHLLRKCPCPVWLMKGKDEPRYKCIVAAADFDPDEPDPVEQALNDEILALAGAVALAESAALHLAHAWDADEAGIVRLWAEKPDTAEFMLVEHERSRHRYGMDKLAQQLRDQIGQEAFDRLSPHRHLLQGPAARCIPQLIRRLPADLVVMGTLGRAGVSGFMIGNTAEAILDQLQCSVLAIKPPGFRSPVAIE